MKLLIITQKVDERDAVLGFMHGWIAEFSKNVDSLIVICLNKGKVNLPNNVKVYSLGKEKLFTNSYVPHFFYRIIYSWRFVRYILQMRNEYDAVFVHMNPEYVVIGGIFWKLLGKKITLWYAHKSVRWHLRVALFFLDTVFTSTASGFRAESRKIKIIGQGIDTERFNLKEFGIDNNSKVGIFRVLTVGRVSPSKDYETLIDAIRKLKSDQSEFISVDIFGPTTSVSDENYLKNLREKIKNEGLNDRVIFKGPVANVDLPEVLADYDLFVNMGHTGSLDKAVPEAMSVGLPILTCNEAFKDVLERFTGDLMYPKGDSVALAGRILWVMNLSLEERRKIGVNLREIVVQNHSLRSFVGKIVAGINTFGIHESN